MTHDPIFEFERDFASTLRCIPMAVRLKLDLCGIKVSLRQWSRFTVDDRQALLQQPGQTPDEIAAYRREVVGLIALRSDEPVNLLGEDVTAAEWADGSAPPASLEAYARSIAIAPVTAEQWRGLTRLQRFTLLKLSRDNHDNMNFVPALHEFGLIGVETAA